MPSYNAPGVYVQDVASGAQSISQASSSVGMLIGTTRSGKVGEAQKIGSWTEFIAKYANGLDTPFMENSYLPYAVYGFFNNGGSELYVGRVAKNAVKASGKGDVNGITAVAANEGVWGNDLKITVAPNADFVEGEYETYDLTLELGVSDSMSITDLKIEELNNIVNTSAKVKGLLSSLEVPDKFLNKNTVETVSTTSVPSGVVNIVGESFTLTGGTDGDELQNADYADALDMAGTLDDLTMIAIPGQTSKIVNDALLAYCDNNGLFPFLDMPMMSTVEETKAYRRSISAWTGALCYPWGKMNDPLTDSLKAVPTCGHMMGVYARTIENSGIHKAPAGTTAVVRGFVEMEKVLTATECATLNPVGVITIMSKPNAGIVSWGARSLNSTDSTMRYVTDGLVNLNIKKSLYTGTQFAVFEPNDEKLWTNVKSACVGFLETLRQNGTLKGTVEEAYYVIVDSTNNTADTIAEGQLNIEVGYAPVKPAEFVIIKLAHSIVAQS